MQPAARRRRDTLEYLQAMLGQLRTMSEAERCDMLSYLIEMAYVEVSDIIRGERPLRPRHEKRDPAAAMAFEPAGEVKLKQH